MRVLQIVNRPQRRGAEVFALELSRELERTGHATRLVALYTGGDLPLRPGDEALGGRAAHPLETLPGLHPGLLRRLARAVDAFRPDVVQVNGSRTVKYGSVLRRLQRGRGWALVYRSIGTPGDWLRGPLHAGLYRRLVVSGVDGIVAVSEPTRADLAERYAPRVPVAVIPRGVDVHRFAPAEDRATLRARLGTAPEAPVMIALGSLSREKRPDRLLRVAAAAARRLPPEPRPELWLVGAGPLAAETAEAAARAAAAPDGGGLTVRLPGATSDPASWLAAADLLLLASDTEGTPGVVLEAGCVGVPAVATRVGGVGELIAEGVTGLTAAPADEDGLAAAAARLLADPGERRRMGQAARRRVEERFALDAIAERYLEHYRRTLARRRGGDE